MVNITVTRRQNALALFQAYAEKALAAGASPKGLEQAFAATLQISPSMWSQIKSSRPIGDKLARQIESACAQSAGWLDEARKDVAPSVAETAFLELALPVGLLLVFTGIVGKRDNEALFGKQFGGDLGAGIHHRGIDQVAFLHAVDQRVAVGGLTRAIASNQQEHYGITLDKVNASTERSP